MHPAIEWFLGIHRLNLCSEVSIVKWEYLIIDCLRLTWNDRTWATSAVIIQKRKQHRSAESKKSISLLYLNMSLSMLTSFKFIERQLDLLQTQNLHNKFKYASTSLQLIFSKSYDFFALYYSTKTNVLDIEHALSTNTILFWSLTFQYKCKVKLRHLVWNRGIKTILFLSDMCILIR